MTDHSLDTLFSLQVSVWATRDACMAHFPRYCPRDCPNAGEHDSELAQIGLGLCECNSCRATKDRGDESENNYCDADGTR